MAAGVVVVSNTFIVPSAKGGGKVGHVGRLMSPPRALSPAALPAFFKTLLEKSIACIVDG